MKEQLSLLIELQKTDSQINKINVRQRSLPEEIVKLEEAFQSFQAGVEGEGKKFAEIQKSHREKEEKLKRGQEALKRSRERLGEVKTNKEYQAVLKEIETIGGKNSETEDEIISLLDIVDNLKEKLTVKEGEMGVRKRQYEGERKKRILNKVVELQLALLKVDNLANMPKSMIRPSNCHPFRRAEIDGDLRLYWWIDNERTLVLHDICNHKEAKDYGDAHK